jgi:predicted PurR-regulated permease PerM
LIRPTVAGTSPATASSRLLTLSAVVVVIAGLYLGRQVLIPFALAVVLAFLLSPVVDALQKCRLGRVPAVLVVLLLAFTVVGSAGWIVTGQLMDIVEQFPNYRSNIHEKIQSLRIPEGSRLKSASNTVSELSAELSDASESAADKKAGKPRHPITVQVSQPATNAPDYIRAVIGPLTGVLETSAVVIVFTLFILVKREDLRNRVIRLAGQNQLNVVTQALDDASRRLSHYLLFQFVVNISYGAIFGCFVYWIGVPHALLWGVLAVLLRFIPYVGTPIAAAFPIGMALAVFPGWHRAALVLAVFIILELLVANVLEPWLYGSHTGISSLAILVAAVFWSVLWGPVGLILSTPLTVCLILMGRYVPQLSFLEVLLGDEAVLPLQALFYQRLLALDDDEATEIAERYLKENPAGTFYDSILIPALSMAEEDRHLNSLETRTSTFIIQSVRELVEELGERLPEADVLFTPDLEGEPPLDFSMLSGLRVVCIPAGDDADEIAAMMAEQLLRRLGCDARSLAIANRANLVNDLATETRPDIAMISALPPFAAGQARSLCRLLRQRYPEMKIVIGLWGVETIAKAQERLGAGCTDLIVTTLREAMNLLSDWKRSTTPLPQSRSGARISPETITAGD